MRAPNRPGIDTTRTCFYSSFSPKQRGSCDSVLGTVRHHALRRPRPGRRARAHVPSEPRATAERVARPGHAGHEAADRRRPAGRTRPQPLPGRTPRPPARSRRRCRPRHRGQGRRRPHHRRRGRHRRHGRALGDGTLRRRIRDGDPDPREPAAHLHRRRQRPAPPRRRGGRAGDVDDQSLGNVDSTQLGWSHVPLGDVLRRELALPVLVENNVNALAMAELLHGQARGHDNVLVVTIGTGIGAGIIADGSVLRGHGGGAGEIGHLPTQEDGPRCSCGADGCLESLIGEGALVSAARTRGIIGEAAGMSTLRGRADAGDTAAQELFSHAGHLLGRALAGVANAIDPEILIILGEGVEAWNHWSYGFEPALRSGLMPRKRGIPVAVETWQDDRWAQGAASLVLATPFDAAGRTGEQGRLVRERLTEPSLRDGAQESR
ncbi:ROK family protein [Microbacterium sp. Se5.02b]|nr:ROK family protein [Microbacterium sp. Se5.02b]